MMLTIILLWLKTERQQSFRFFQSSEKAEMVLRKLDQNEIYKIYEKHTSARLEKFIIILL